MMQGLSRPAAWLAVLAVALAVARPSLAQPANLAAKARTEAANKALVLEFYRVVFEPQDTTRAKDFMAPDVIEHNPNALQGLDGFVKGFGSRWTPKPVQAALRSPPVVVLADGDYVQLVFKRPRPDPAHPGQTYDSYWFDLFRIKNGKFVEHWDGALKPTPPPR